MSVNRSEHVVARHWRVCPTCADAMARIVQQDGAASVRAEQMVASVDAALEGRCAGPGCGSLLTEQSLSGYFCGPGCQEAWNRRRTDRPDQVRGSEGVDPSEMRWRPDLVTAFDDSDLELTDEIADCGLLDQLVGTATRRRWYRARHGRWFLRLDDGHRWVGAWVPDEAGEQERRDLWRRLERELTDPRRLGGEPVATVAPDYFRVRTDDYWWAYNLVAEGVLEQLQRWLSANGVDPGDVVRNSDEHEIDEGHLHLECYVRNEGGHMLLDDTGRGVRTEVRSVPLVEPLPDVMPPAPTEGVLDQLRRVNDDLLRTHQANRAFAWSWLGPTIQSEPASHVLRVTDV